MKVTNQQIAEMNWKAVDEAADAIKRACRDVLYVAPDFPAGRMTYVRRVADQLTAIAAALHITPPDSKGNS